MTTLKNSLFALAASALLLTGTASAQPVSDEDDTSGAVDEEVPSGLEGETPPDEPAATPEPAPPVPVVEEPPPAPAPAPPVLAESSSDRPEGFTIGLGFGYVLPADIDQPNTVSVRFRLANGIVFEPRMVLETQQSTDDNGTDETKDAMNTVSLATTMRYPLIQRGPFDFIFAGGLGLGFSSQDPDGADNNSSYTSISLTWGIAIDYWLSQHWCFSLSAYNPFISYTSQEQELGTMSATQSQTEIGAIFDPTIVALLHLFY